MKYLIKNSFFAVAVTLIGACLLLPATALAAANGNGQGGGQPDSTGGGVGELADAIAELEAEVALLQIDVADLAVSIADLGVVTVTADCGTDGAALQAAIDSAPAAGAIINVVGQCNSTAIIGRTNLLLDGGAITSGNGIAGSLHVDASRNIQLTGLTVAGVVGDDAVRIANNSSVLLNGDFSAQGNTAVEINSSLVQLAGHATIAGEVNGSLSAQIIFRNASLGGFSLTRSSSLVLNAQEAPNSIVVNGTMGLFSGSHLLAQADSESGGTVSLTSVDAMLVQRVSAALFAGDNLQVSVPLLLIRQNAVLDVLFMLQGNFNVDVLRLLQGSGSRMFPADVAPVNFVAECDDSAWTNAYVSCPE